MNIVDILDSYTNGLAFVSAIIVLIVSIALSTISFSASKNTKDDVTKRRALVTSGITILFIGICDFCFLMYLH